MADIIDITKKPEPEEEPGIWVCICGCSTFHLNENNLLRCSACDNTLHPEAEGGWERPETDQKWEGEPSFADVYGNGSVEFAQRRMQQRVADPNTCLIVVATQEGSVSAWSRAETKEQLEWVQEKLDDAFDLIEGFTTARGK